MILQAIDLARKFGSTTALRRASLHVARGERVAIVGRSGSGKSSLLALLGMLDRPDSGRILLDGRDVWAMSERARAGAHLLDFGFVFQRCCLIEHLSVRDNVALPAWRAGRSRTDALEHADALLLRVGLENRRDALAGVLSAGEAQRAALARAVINQPRVLLADEPTGALDTDNARRVIGLLRSFTGRDRSLVVVTHHTEVAAAADRVLRMADGVLGEDAPAEAACATT